MISRNVALKCVAAVLAAVAVTLFPADAHAQATSAQPGPVLSPKGDGKTMAPMRRTTQADRVGAALRAMERRKAYEATKAKAAKQKAPSAPEARSSGAQGLHGAAAALLRMALAQVGTPDLYAIPNYATSKYPTATCSASSGTCQKDADCPGYLPPYLIGPDLYAGGETCTGPVVSGGIRKFVDTLPGLCALGKNNLGNCLPLATPDTTTFPGADYYELGLKDYVTQFHTDLPNKTKVRGYYQKNTSDLFASKNQYLGPIILAHTNRPVRVKFVNELGIGAAGDLFVPMDAGVNGTGLGPDGLPYTQNRATIHLHGGNSPWISDGTQHQWTVPAGDPTTHKRGLSVEFVPDMWFDVNGAPIAACSNLMSCAVPGASNDPGDGTLTFYWTNQQSGRLMFFHDHAYGITRLNVYAGEAAGYLLVNPPDEDRLAAAMVPGTIGTTTPDLAHMIPLIIQDKSFVPPAAQLAVQDPTWDTAKWGGEDAMWFPHVYTPNQWPGNPDLSNTNPMGRWDYGPWFWPVQSSLTSVTWDGKTVDRPLTVPCNSAAAVTDANPSGATDCPSLASPSLVPETFLDTPVVNGTAYPTLTVDPVSYRFQILNAANERNLNLSIFVADASGTEVSTVDAVPHTAKSTPPICAANAPKSAVTGTPNGPDITTPACWPHEWPVDARQGGVPDPSTVGPKWIQIGSEAGLLPAPAVIPPTPVNYELNKRNIVVLNVAAKSLFMGPAERADVVVDFSAYAGKTLILYNDSPAPVPAGDPRQDLYTGAPDQTTVGGAPTPLPGYGPNNRTIMQIKVGLSAPGTPPNLTAITTALNQSFAASQPTPIVPEAVYNQVYNPPALFTNTYLPIQALSLSFTPVGETTPLTIPFGNKALHELFTSDYGRMNSLLGVEIPNTNWLNQTTIPFANYDPTTEYLTDGQPQIWKITHNGVDTHTIHFHLFNAQIVNRVGWDGQIRAPDANELGWKESVRMNPLEDIIIALKPVKQNLPWPLPDKIRPLDVDRPLGTASQFTGVDVNNLPIQITNQLVNFGQEYVWHCHLLGHEEEDMLRAEVLVVAPEAASGLVAALFPSGPRRAVLAWQDNSRSALSFSIQRDTTPEFLAPTNLSAPAPAKQPGPVTFTDRTVAANTTYFYRVQAQKVLTSPALPGQSFPASSAWSAVVQALPAPVAKLTPAALVFGNRLVNTTSPRQTVTLTNTGNALLTIGSIALTGTNAADFAISSNTCGATLAVNAACAVGLTFHPLAPGARSAGLRVVTNDPFNPTQTAVTTGTGTAPIAGVTPASLAFASQVLNTTSPAQTVTLSNTGTGPLSITSITASGANAGDFTVTKTCGATLASGASCTISVTFKPAAIGARAASISIVSSDLANPTLTVGLSGVGIYPPATGVTITPSSPSPHTNGMAVTFTAVGSGPAIVPASAYQYRFSVNDGTGARLVQDYGVGSAWTLPAGTFTGAYTITVDVRTSTTVALDRTSSIAYQVTNPPATGVTLTASVPSPQLSGTPVVFTAAGQGSFGYQYRFWLVDPAGTWTIMQDYSAVATWNLPASTVTGDYWIVADVRTNSATYRDASTSMSYQIVGVSPATGVTLSAGLPSPQAVGTSVQFTASGQGSTNYQYRFWIVDPAGIWTIVQDYSAVALWSLPTSTAVGNYWIVADVRTNSATNRDATTSMYYQIVGVRPATGVTLSAGLPSPQAVGTSVQFTASGQGSTNYQYRFWIVDPAGTWTIVQDYSAVALWSLPTSTAVGNYWVVADVRTNSATYRDASTSMMYVMQ